MDIRVDDRGLVLQTSTQSARSSECVVVDPIARSWGDSSAPRPMADEPLHATVSQRGVVFAPTGEVLIVRRTTDGGWELPGDRADRGERAVARIRREIVEETTRSPLLVRPSTARGAQNGGLTRRTGLCSSDWVGDIVRRYCGLPHMGAITRPQALTVSIQLGESDLVSPTHPRPNRRPTRLLRRGLLYRREVSTPSARAGRPPCAPTGRSRECPR